MIRLSTIESCLMVSDSISTDENHIVMGVFMLKQLAKIYKTHVIGSLDLPINSLKGYST